MSDADTAGQVVATPAARRAISDLCRQGQVMFVQSGGCCGGTAPMCFRLGEFITGVMDVLLGEIDGCPFYMDERLYQAWGEPSLVLDVEPGFAEGFSLAASAGQHFVVHGQAAAHRSCPE
jgi:uncharacterized protein (DUF779 family)